jgi:energy-coupling factor transport system ATP-binding protein
MGTHLALGPGISSACFPGCKPLSPLSVEGIVIAISQVSYRYPGSSQLALRDLTLTVPDGQFLSVVGANGSGKTSLANIIAGFIPHFYHGTISGDVIVEGKHTWNTPLHELMLSVGYVFQNPYNQISGTKFTVRGEIAFGLENLGLPVEEMERRIGQVMETMEITDLANRSPLALSGGQMQRVAIASILAMQPKILILDEPTSQLDPAGTLEVFTAIRRMMEKHPMTVIMIEHKLEWLAVYADRTVVLANGEMIADGQPGEVLSDERLHSHGMGQTRYTLVSQRARHLGLWPDDLRPAVTLEEALKGFQAARKSPGND